MDKYHIFNEIGTGRASQVFKGRQKKTVHYVAIKRIEKGQMDKVVNEVQIMHALAHPHTLKFYDWYETRNNLWLILEYCSGGDLKSILKVDKQLPIAAVKLFGGDLLSGLEYLHYHGLLYCDLKPSNVLIDDSGVLKLAGFGLARRIPTQGNRGRAPKNRGTPYYMAPELFVKDGVHSFASDFWSLGCVLYELASGRPPFASTSLHDLMEQIVSSKPSIEPRTFEWKRSGASDQPPAYTSRCVQACAPHDFCAAVKALLEKQPRDRPQWRSMRFGWWSNVLSPNKPTNDLPPQPLFERMTPGDAAFVRPAPPGAAPAAANTAAANAPPPPPGAQPQPDAARSKGRTARDSSPARDAGDVDLLRVSRNYETHRAKKKLVTTDKPESLAFDNETVSSALNSPVEPTTKRLRGQAAKRDEAAQEPASGSTAAASSRGESTPAGNQPKVAPKGETPGDAQGEKGAPWWDGGDLVPPRALEALLFSDCDSHVSPILHSMFVDQPRCDEARLPFSPKSNATLAGLAQAQLEAHLVIAYKALVSVQPEFVQQRGNVVDYLRARCGVSQVANVIVNSSFVTLLLKLLRGGGEGRDDAAGLDLRLLLLLASLVRHATYVAADAPDAADATSLAPTLVSLLHDEAFPPKLKRIALAALGELVFYIATQDDDETAQSEEDAPKWELTSEIVDAVTMFVLKPGADEALAQGSAKTLENFFAQANSHCCSLLVSPQLVSRLAFLGNLRTRESRCADASGRYACAALSQLLRHAHTLAVEDGLTAPFAGSKFASLAQAAVAQLGGMGALAQAAASALFSATSADEARWQLVVLNLLNAGLATDPELDRLENHLPHDVVHTLARSICGGRCLAAAVRAKAAVALFQLGLDEVKSFDCEHANDNEQTIGGTATAVSGAARRSDVVVALERVATRDVHHLRADDYLAQAALQLVAFVADAATLVAASLAARLGDAVEDRGATGPPDPAELDLLLPAARWAGAVSKLDRASLSLVASAIASPLVKSRILTAPFLENVSQIVAALAAAEGSPTKRRRAAKAMPMTYQAVRGALPLLLDALVSCGPAELFRPHAVLLNDSLLPAACALVGSSGDGDVRLAASQLLRHALPVCCGATNAGSVARHVSALAATLLGGDRRAGDAQRLPLEAEIVLRLLLETPPPSAPLFAESEPLLRALASCAENRRTAHGTHLPRLAEQLLKHLCSNSPHR